jgi:DNA-binding FrmR family transcriptional regulator
MPVNSFWSPEMDAEENKKLLDRLARIEGQVRGLRNMLEQQRCCEDVLTQLLAARSGLEQASLLILDRHLEDCVLDSSNVDPATLTQLRDTLKLWSRHTSHVG